MVDHLIKARRTDGGPATSPGNIGSPPSPTGCWQEIPARRDN